MPIAGPAQSRPGDSGANIVRLSSLSPEAISSLFTELDVLNAVRASGAFYTSSLSELDFIKSVTKGGTFKVLRLARHIQEDRENGFFICLNLGRGIGLTHSGRDCVLEKGDLALLDTTRAYALDMPDRMNAIWVRVPRAALEARVLGLDDLVGRRIPGTNGLGQVVSHILASSAAAAATLSHHRAPMLAATILDMLSAAASDLVTAPSKGRSRSCRQTLRRAHAYIEDQLSADDLDPTRIAQGVGVSTRYLHDLFASEGQTVMGWLLVRRLHWCKRLLEDPSGADRQISEIALTCGFANVSSFNRAFKAAFGRTPRTCRMKAS